ncbi:hypothetical protein [Hansschlegelia zhihuaiae]|uniref:Uncharacterized protein n=1 Tax=Hansschlegelia zhihuaiae TaxID=405005 RepID=A0A4Q0MLY7_9HYPH|nr:hypothetical protein [Hansschlegelia zhihuaiae]RXF74079.1 hypothetical protein EK403_06820 [Hansschlegelia zhihuaiae]
MSNSRRLNSDDRDYRLSKLIAEPLPGWKPKSEKVEAFSSDTVGCGLSAVRLFDTGRGDLSFAVSLVASPIAAGMAQSLNAAPGRRIKFDGRSILIDDMGTMTLPLGRIMVTVWGPAPEEDKRALLEILDFRAIERASAPQ